MKLLLIASVISVPLSVFMLNKYLSNYAFHVNLNISTYALALFLATFVALVAISYQLFTALRTDPAKSLKYE
jgi:putative ABC transport system permease protein